MGNRIVVAFVDPRDAVREAAALTEVLAEAWAERNLGPPGSGQRMTARMVILDVIDRLRRLPAPLRLAMARDAGSGRGGQAIVPLDAERSATECRDVLQMSRVLTRLVDDQLRRHPVVQADVHWSGLADRAVQCLDELCQAISDGA